MPRVKSTALQAAVRLLEARTRSVEGLRSALRTRGYPEAELEAALARVQELGYLDDARHAALRAAQLLAQGKAQGEVQRRLGAEGVGEGVALAAVDEEARRAGHTDEAAARALLTRRKLTGLKAARFLAGRGFDEELIARLVPMPEV
jgi:regulatory protein